MDSVNKKYEITHPQKRIWYNEILFPNLPMHNITSKIHIGKNLNITLLEKAINLIIEKNDSLRLKFCEDNGKLYEYIEPYKFMKISYLDFSQHNEAGEKLLKEFCDNEGKKILFKENQLLFKFFMYKINEEKMGICFVMHHIIIDGCSVNLMLNQLGKIYEQLLKGDNVNDKVENSYINFIHEEKEYLNSEEFLNNKLFWNEKFSNLNEGSLYINPKSIKSKSKIYPINTNILTMLKSFLKENKISLNKFFITISSIYTNKIFNENDITLAVATFNRSTEGQRNTVGMFTGTMPLRVKIEDNITYNEFLEYINRELKGCYSNQKYPYDLLVQDLELKKRGFDSLFNFCVNYYLSDSCTFDNELKITMENEVVFQEYSNVPLHILVNEHAKDGQVELEIHYRVSNYTEKEIDEMVEGMELITNQVINNSDIKLSQIEIVSEEEKNIIINEFNNTKREYDKAKTIKDLFEEASERVPNKTAVVSNGQLLNYKELNERSNQLGNLLRKKGITKDSIVSILCDRSVDTIVGMLAVIKSGAAYLPIDEDYPESRIKYLLEDSRSKILLSKNHLLDKVSLEEINIEVIDINSEEILKENKESLININTPEDLAYVIYTSGSTGNPKGVCTENRALVKLVNNPNYIQIQGDDKVLQSGSLSFDASVFQVWIALLNGITLHLEEKSLIVNDAALEAYINENKITVMLMPTPLFNQYSQSNIELFKNLRCLIVGGDVLASKQLSKLTKLYKDLKVLNAYGPTENSVISTVYKVKGQWDENIAVPIGNPISNSTAYIMDKNNNLLPIGVAGELCVGGDGLARGYLNREELTKEKFIENPYVKGERIYKTGDLAKWMPDGNIHFMGRIDYQVKIRGFRIELEEIEAHLVKYTGITEAAVVDKEDENGNKYLCGYVVSEGRISSKEIKDFLKKELPSYMIPSYIMQLENMPINCNGKVDRKALPIPDLSQSDVEFINPRNEIEQRISDLWCELFNMKKISVKDNFFEIGGHSLMAINLVSKIHKEFKVKITAADVFNLPSIEELAKHLNCMNLENKNGFDLSFKGIEKVDESDYYEASAVQKRIYAVNQTNVKSTNYNIPFAYVIRGDFDKHRFENAICELINRHEALRTSFHLIDGDVVQKIHFDVDFQIEHIKINRKFDEGNVEEGSFIKPFDLSNAPLIRSCIIEFLDASLLIIDMHHIISDGVSIGIIIKELSSLYNGKELEELKIQYKDFSTWQNRLYKNGLLEKQEKYWLDKFKGEIFTLNMPSDYKKVSNEDFNGDVINFEINKELAYEIDKTLNSLGITKFMFYVTAYNVLLYKYTGQEDLIIGTPAVGRTHEDVKGTVGMFVNTLPFKNKVKGAMSFNELLKEVKINSLMDYENQEYDLKNLVEKLNLKGSSLFDMIFTFRNETINSLEFKNTEISTYKLKNNISKFNISMILEEDSNKISGILEYQTAVYNKETMENFAKHYVNILREVLKDLDSPIDKVDILAEEEKALILNKFNNTKREYHRDTTIGALFEKVVEGAQDKVALVSKGQRLTYKELNERANQLGNLLRKKGITKNSIVPIICDRSIDTIIGMLAVVKSGAAYLPIDEEYPESRIKYMLEDSNSSILLIKKHQLHKINLEEIRTELLDLNDEEINKEDEHNIVNINSPEDLAYVIYTSGSTGKPKGVCLENRGLVKIVNNPNYIQIQEDDKILQSGSLSFDASVLQVWLALLNGIPLHLEDKTLIIDDAALEVYIHKNKITVMVMPTPLFNQYSQSNIRLFKNFRCLIVGGDVLSSKQVSKITKKYKHLKIINGYGPTENSVISTAYEVQGGWDENIAIPIGGPVSNSTTYIMDKSNNLLPIGVAGELCVGGDGLARGYLNREELTKEKFIENPYIKGERLYKTGDLAKWLPDGNIHFMGRIDYQVKINGFRIELEEIEAQMLKYPKLKEAAVTDKRDESGNRYLCGYVVSEEKISPKELKEFLKKEIPGYMIPSYIIQLENMPVNCNGKVDRKALPDPDLSNLNEEYTAPTNHIEEKISAVWSAILGIKKVSIDSNFFEIGGNSLKAISVVSKLSKEFKIVINDIFKYPTIQELALNITIKKHKILKKVENTEEEVAATKLEEKDENLNVIPQAIKPLYDGYIEDIESYKKFNLHNETSYKNILLTGATGYVGVNILKELIFSTDSKVYLILRGKTIREAEERLIQKTDFYFGEEFYTKYKNRINIVTGNISEDYLGLDINTYNKLSLKIDCIINSAANVKHYGKYEDFYGVNVLGTKHLLDFAEKGLRKDFNQISTLSVGHGNIPGTSLVMFSESQIDIGQESDNVYVRSKLEAEKLVEEAGKNTLNTKIFRVGNVTFNYETGLFQENITENAFYQNIKSFIKLNCIPKIEGNTLDFCFVDQLSKAIVMLFNKSSLNNQVFHIVNPNKISTSHLAQLLRVKYENIELKNTNEFISYIALKSDSEELRQYVDNVMVHFGFLEESNSTAFITVHERTKVILSELGFEWSKFDEAAAERMLAYCEKVKFL